MNTLKIRRVLFSVSDKEGIADLARAFDQVGAELVATGKTAQVLRDAGLSVRPIEEISGAPESFRGRMKTLSFPVCSGILYRRGDAEDEADLARLKILPIDAVVVNFYPFEEAAAKADIKYSELVDQIDIGGPTLVRAAAKNAPQVLVLTSPEQYGEAIKQLHTQSSVDLETVRECAATAWKYVSEYDQAIASKFSFTRKPLRYGENPHQQGWLEVEVPESHERGQLPIAWPLSPEEALTSAELSYNNILDLSAAYALGSDLAQWKREFTGVIIVKHNNPCGVAMVPKGVPAAQKLALRRAWEGDPVSAFGGVVVFTDPIERESAEWLRERFVELVAAPELDKSVPGNYVMETLLGKRKNLKAVKINRWDGVPPMAEVSVPGGKLIQTADLGPDKYPSQGKDSMIGESVTKVHFEVQKRDVAQFGVFVCRAVKSNAIVIVRDCTDGTLQLVGVGQGQPNRIDALSVLAVPRAQRVLAEAGGKMEDCVLVSDAFFPFRDSVDAAHAAGIRRIVQPGGSIKDAESVQACDEHGMAMILTGIRHFRH